MMVDGAMVELAMVDDAMNDGRVGYGGRSAGDPGVYRGGGFTYTEGHLLIPIIPSSNFTPSTLSDYIPSALSTFTPSALSTFIPATDPKHMKYPPEPDLAPFSKYRAVPVVRNRWGYGGTVG